jgi:preprotein translocase subunit SecY
MRDPIVAQKVGNRSGIGKGRSGAGQRPAKRENSEPLAVRIKSVLRYVPLALRIAVVAIVCLIAFVARLRRRVSLQSERSKQRVRRARRSLIFKPQCVAM